MKKILSALALAVATFTATATPVQGTLTRGAFEHTPTVTGTVQVGSNVLGSMYIGAMNAEFLPVGADPFDFESFLMYCVDLFTAAANQGIGVTYDKVDFVTTVNPFDRIGQLFTVNGGLDTADASASAAMQLAIWNVMYDNDLDVSTGSFGVVSVGGTGVVSKANALLTSAATATNLWDVSFLTDFEYATVNKTGYQDYVTGSFNSGCSEDCGNEIPEPSGIALAGLGLGALALTRRRKSKDSV